jgi:hypothetical protein
MKWVSELNRHFFKENRPNNQKTHEEMLNNPGFTGKANQNHFKIPPQKLDRFRKPKAMFSLICGT